MAGDENASPAANNAGDSISLAACNETNMSITWKSLLQNFEWFATATNMYAKK